jgi:hypothetical protein
MSKEDLKAEVGFMLKRRKEKKNVYGREYNWRPEVKLRRATAKSKQQRSEYSKRPEVKDRANKLGRERRKRQKAEAGPIH